MILINEPGKLRIVTKFFLNGIPINSLNKLKQNHKKLWKFNRMTPLKHFQIIYWHLENEWVLGVNKLEVYNSLFNKKEKNTLNRRTIRRS